MSSEGEGTLAGMANETERRRWNDGRWVDEWTKREQMTDVVTPVLLAAAAPAPGERVLDVGCGGGKTSLAAARAVGPDGLVVGADLSDHLAGLARRRAAEGGAENARFLVADVQTASFEEAPFDAAMSQFGVMFFDEPVTAFANIGAHLRPGGRLAFACWQHVQANPWFVGAALAGLVPAPPAPAAGKSPTGPFSLAGPDHVRATLEAAGFEEVQVAGHEHALEATEDLVMDDAQLAFLGVPEGAVPAARTAIDAHLAPLRSGPGRLRIPLAFQVVTARRPG